MCCFKRAGRPDQGRGLGLPSLLLSAALLLGCAQPHQRLRDEAQTVLRAGDYEQAVQQLEAALAQAPGSPVLRSGLLQARSEALTRLLTEAATHRASGRLDEADATLQRAKRFDGGGKRVDALLFDLDTEKRQRKAVQDAQTLAAKGQHEQALRLVQQALKDNPRQPELLALQRRLEIDARPAATRGSLPGLAETRPISLDFRDAGLRQVLDVVTRHSGVNFVLDKDIRGDIRVTTFLRSARVEDAIDLITSTHQLAKKVVDEKTVLIYPNTPEKQREHQEQMVKVFYLATAEAKGAAAFLRAMLRIKEPFVDERSNMLALRETPETIELAERLVALYDTHEPEVLLELEVLEVRASRLTDVGIKFPDSVSLTALSPTGAAGGLTLGNIGSLNRDRIGLGVGNVLLNLKREVGDFSTLANPRIRAKNREKAKILIGDKVPIITATTGQGGFVSDSVNYLDVGLKLEVEPTVYADDEVSIRIALEVSTLGTQVRTSSGSLVYQIGTRNANTALRLRDGETQLLAGLISNDDRSSASRIPGLGDLPVAGRLFSSQRDDNQRTELILAITPRILRNLRQPEANRTELWVGTENQTRMRPMAGQRSTAASDASAAPAGPGGGVTLSAADALRPAKLSWQGPAVLRPGESFSLGLDLETEQALRGTPVRLGYNKALLELVDVEEGDFFRRAGASSNFSKSVDAAAGTARAGVMRNGGEGATGKARLLNFKFRALAAGTAEVSVQSIDPIAVDGADVKLEASTPWRLEVK